MSQQSEKDNFNLLLNGNFLAGGANWTANSPEKVEFVNGHCGLQLEAEITQSVAVNGAGDFEFAVRMKTNRGFACRATLVMLPSKVTKLLNTGGGSPWLREAVTFKAPADTTEMKVTLLSDDGTRGEFGSYFDYVSLVPVSS
ncbi:hypothetical protein PMI18_01856 [Pseudomonas sp. GM102]|uniref:hypothetical protein n=1 Tax=Pseudomonas sp. GM102 TaxID=1144321 RepID=UPI00026F6EC9|nr:hypothetical protein [Pseudomonas sp. GM102]EJM03117.1 hypothetical protein PMI18_01856 [Pseudomonas sp. GM102]